MGERIKIYICCSGEKQDEDLQMDLVKHLKVLQTQEGPIDIWYKREISAGAEVEYEINKSLTVADIILLLVTPDFFNSEPCMIEMRRAMERYKSERICVIPVILRPFLTWQGKEFFGGLQMLPRNGKSITDNSFWPNLDHAFFDVAKEICEKIELLIRARQEQERIDLARRRARQNTQITLEPFSIRVIPSRQEGNTIAELWEKGANALKLDRTREALEAYEHITRLLPNNPSAYNQIGALLDKLEKWEEALLAYHRAAELGGATASTYRIMVHLHTKKQEYEKALEAYKHLSTPDATSYEICIDIGYAFRQLKYYQDALVTYNNGLRSLDQESPSDKSAHIYYEMGYTYVLMGKYNEALEAFNRAIRYGNHYAQAHAAKGDIYYENGLYPEAQEAYKGAIRCNPKLVWAHYGLGTILRKLERFEEALRSYREALKYDPDNREGYNCYIYTYIGDICCNDRKKLDEAYKYYVRAIKFADKNSDLVDLYNKTGDVLIRLGKKKEAQECYSQARKIDE